jgi:hypothetical protein
MRIAEAKWNKDQRKSNKRTFKFISSQTFSLAMQALASKSRNWFVREVIETLKSRKAWARIEQKMKTKRRWQTVLTKGERRIQSWEKGASFNPHQKIGWRERESLSWRQNILTGGQHPKRHLWGYLTNTALKMWHRTAGSYEPFKDVIEISL